MVFPNFKDKHLHEVLFDPVDYIKTKKLTGKYPKKYILTYHTSVKNHFVRKYKTKKTEINPLLTIYSYKNIGFIRMTGIGAPHAATILDELIALGGKEFLNIGISGGLHHQGIFIADKALRDEGTSHHYLPFGKYSYPDKQLTKQFETFLKNIQKKAFKQ